MCHIYLHINENIMSDLVKLRENLGAQVAELESLQSVYPEELKFSDFDTLADINDFISGILDEVHNHLEYSIEISVSEGSVDLNVSLSANYPKVKPEVYVRGSTLEREQQKNLNEALQVFVERQESEIPIIYDIIMWMQDNLAEFLRPPKNKLKNRGRVKKIIKQTYLFRRYWIYSHHIKCSDKRKKISEEAKANSLTGFSLIGKPGIICIEGSLEDCEKWWQIIKMMNWQKIGIKTIEAEISEDENVDNLRKFSNFEELIFPITDGGSRMGRLLQYMTDHQSQHIFKEYFGVEGKLTIT